MAAPYTVIKTADVHEKPVQIEVDPFRTATLSTLATRRLARVRAGAKGYPRDERHRRGGAAQSRSGTPGTFASERSWSRRGR